MWGLEPRVFRASAKRIANVLNVHFGILLAKRRSFFFSFFSFFRRMIASRMESRDKRDACFGLRMVGFWRRIFSSKIFIRLSLVFAGLSGCVRKVRGSEGEREEGGGHEEGEMLREEKRKWCIKEWERQTDRGRERKRKRDRNRGSERKRERYREIEVEGAKAREREYEEDRDERASGEGQEKRRALAAVCQGLCDPKHTRSSWNSWTQGNGGTTASWTLGRASARAYMIYI